MSKLLIEASIPVQASLSNVFDAVADFHRRAAWSPWLCAEPDAKVTISEDGCSVGATYVWEGEVIGAGDLQRVEVDQNRILKERLRIRKPFPSQSDITFTFEPQGEGALVTWRMDGSWPWFLFFMKAQIQTVIWMDFQRGLKMLKDYVETGEVHSSSSIPGIRSNPRMQVVGIRRKVPYEQINQIMSELYSRLPEEFARAGLPTEDHPVAVYHEFNMKERIFDLTAGFIVSEIPASVPAPLSQCTIPAGKTFNVEHAGSYRHLGNGWFTMMFHARHRKLKQCSSGAFELYLSSGENQPDSEIRTLICMPLR
ncbi:MAG: GyrI-like domain-containing protein [Planctomycetaceae bacterium]|nr:GyrI-like domain-containing protein [Planctomycetaceae bacterium]